MKPAFALLLASTALTAAFGLPALAAILTPDSAIEQPTMDAAAPDAMPLLLADNDDDDNQKKKRRSKGHDDNDDEGDDDDDDDDEEEDDDDDECDDDDCNGATSNPAPAGTVAPPANGLFGNGAPPQVQVN